MPNPVLTLLKEITLSLDKPNDLVFVSAKQYDMLSRKIKINLLVNNTPWIIPDDLNSVIRYIKPDRTVGMYDTDEEGNPASVITTGTDSAHPGDITITLARQALTTKGTVKIEVSLYSAASEKLTTFAFPLVVEEATLGDLPFFESENYFSFTQDMAAIRQLIAAFDEATQAAVSGSITIDKTLSITGAVAEAKSTGDSIFNSTRNTKDIDLLWPSNRIDTVNNDITFSWSADKRTCYVSGTASAVARNYFCGGTNVIPRGIIPGKTYIAKVFTSNPKISLVFYYYIDGNYSTYGSAASPYSPVTIPEGITGMYVLISVPSGTILSGIESITFSLVEEDSIDENIFRFDEQLINSGSYIIQKSDLESGSWVYSSKSYNLARCRTKFFIPVKAGMTIKYKNTTCDIMLSILATTTSTTFIQDFGWKTDAFGELSITSNGFLTVAFRDHSDPTASITIDDFTSVIEIITDERKKIDAIDNTVNILYDLEENEFYIFSENDMERGGWNTNTPTITKWKTSTRIRNKYVIYVHSGTRIEYNISDNINGYILIEPKDTSLSRQSSNFSAGDSGYVTASVNGYLYISISKLDSSEEIVPSDFDGTEIKINNINYNAILKSKDTVPDLTDLNDITDFGVYNLVAGNAYDNMPSGSDTAASHYLIVYKAFPDRKSCIQQLIPLLSRNNYIFQRICYSNGTWEPWKLIGNSAKGTLPSNTDLNDIMDQGTYLLSILNTPYLHVPDFINSTSSYLFVITSDARSAMSEQIIFPYNSSVICRRQYIYSTSSWGEWYITSTDDVNNNEYLSAVIDNDGRLLESQKSDGKHFYTPLHPDSGIFTKDFNLNLLESKEPIMSAITDSNGGILEAITNKEKQFNIPVSFKKINWTEENATDLVEALKDFGVMIQSPTDWSDAEKLSIPEPRCAVANITGIDSWPVSKTVDYHAWLQFWDCQGNYFKKRIIFNAQGQSSMQLPKKNGAIDICNDEWEGDDTFSLRIGKWVAQDSFHLKAYYLDYFKGVAVVTYQLMNDVLLTRNIWEDRPWKKALIDIDNVNVVADNFGGIQTNDLELDTGARNFPDGFPCVVFLNGSFYGLYSWQLKKNRDNYHMNKNNADQVHLDGSIGFATILGGYIDWVTNTGFEIRNPKSLLLMNGEAYDGDYTGNTPQELMDETSAYYDSTKSKCKNSAKVKHTLEKLSNALLSIRAKYDIYAQLPAGAEKEVAKQEVKDEFETYFDVDNIIDYQIVSDIVNNIDGFRRNWQWTTYDGTKWFINPYDVDMSFGAWGLTTGMMSYPPTTHISLTTTVKAPDQPSGYINYNPGFYITRLYQSNLENRYAQLRRLNVIDAHRITSMMNDWVMRYSSKYYDKEYEKWPNNPCHSESTVNSQYWQLIEGDGTEPRWDPSATYQAGDRCKTQIGDSHIPPNTIAQAPYYTVEAITTVPPSPADHSTAPIKWNYYDSIYRFSKWIIQNIENMDTLYNYSST